ncbi:helix-turn-helix domain-containing protein [Mucilaginibacter psychrotolerans]|nr:AraC family transcriptional regulator [Mucilaginibacter psychrotolerans]
MKGGGESKKSYLSVSCVNDTCFERRPQQNHDCYTVIFIERGICECHVSNEVLSLTSSSIAVIKPGQTFNVMLQKGSIGNILSFSFEFMQTALNSAGMAQEFHSNCLAGTVCVPEADRSFLTDIISRLRQEFQTNNGLREEILRGLFQIFALYLNRISAPKLPNNQNRCLYHANRFFALLDEHFATLKMPADYANLLAVSPSYLNFIIKENFGLNTGYFIQQRVLSEAKKLMTAQEMTMKEVAYTLGFFDVSHFSKFFKRNTGIRFTDFRRAKVA